MNINESYDGKTWLKDWWVIVKNNFAIIKNKVADITSDIAIINTQINKLSQEKKQKDLIVTCNGAFEGRELTITDASASYNEIKKAIENYTDVILKIVISDTETVYYARLEGDGDNSESYFWVFSRNEVLYRICNDHSNIWYVFATEFATPADIDKLDQKIDGEITDNINDKKAKDFVVTCNAKINTKDDTVTITNVSASYSEIRAAYENGIDVILKADFGDACFYYARINDDSDGDYTWNFWHSNRCICNIWCYCTDEWYGRHVDLATKEKLDDSLSEAIVRIDDLTDSFSDANARINELDEKISDGVFDDIDDKQSKDFIVNCEIISIDNTIVTIGNPSASYDKIKEAFDAGHNVVLKVYNDFDHFANLTEYDGDFCWRFMYDSNVLITIFCLSDNTWRGISTHLTTKKEVETMISVKADKEGEYEFIEQVIVGYSITTSQPEDWETNYTSYFKNTGTAIEPVYTALTELETWESGKYYAYDETGGYALDFTEEPDGTAFSFSKIYIYWEDASAYGSNKNGCLNVRTTKTFPSLTTNEKIRCNGNAMYITQLASQNAQAHIITAEISNNLLQMKNYYGEYGNISAYSVTTPLNPDEKITGFRIRGTSAACLMGNTKIYIYGVRE